MSRSVTATAVNDTQQEQLWNAPLAMAAIAHEIRNPLLAVSANMELLHEQMDAHDPRRRCVDRALSEVDRLSGVVDRLVEFASTQRPELERVSLSEFTLDAVTRERRLLEHEAEAGAACTIELQGVEGCDVEVSIDRQLVSRVVANLLRNAADAAGERGRVVVSVEVDDEAAVAVLRVEDDGPGVAGGMGERIFEPFVTTKSNGTGLGLPFSRRIARAHGGDLVAHEGRSGRFDWTIPLAAAPAMRGTE